MHVTRAHTHMHTPHLPQRALPCAPPPPQAMSQSDDKPPGGRSERAKALDALAAKYCARWGGGGGGERARRRRRAGPLAAARRAGSAAPLRARPGAVAPPGGRGRRGEGALPPACAGPCWPRLLCTAPCLRPSFTPHPPSIASTPPARGADPQTSAEVEAELARHNRLAEARGDALEQRLGQARGVWGVRGGVGEGRELRGRRGEGVSFACAVAAMCLSSACACDRLCWACFACL
jgi:hypothetical protein